MIKIDALEDVERLYKSGFDIWVEDFDSDLATPVGKAQEDTLEEVLNKAKDAYKEGRKVFYHIKNIKTQKQLNDMVQQLAKVNIVNCGMCGGVFLHEIGIEEITCPYCNFTSDPCNFPDFIYE